MTCLQCGAEMPPNLLVCPTCHALVHAAELKTVFTKAESAAGAGDSRVALENWRRALELLPRDSKQHSIITQKINEAVRQLDASELKPKAKDRPAWASGAGALGALGLLFWKFKFALTFLLAQGKFLFLGLKASTFLSMLVSAGVYFTVMGWKLAAGLVLSIYVHEMGHVYRLTRYGIKATAPMFIPGLGAIIRQKQYPASPHEDARVGLAGPIWGLAAAGISYALSLGTDLPIFAAIARLGALINLFNLIPVWQLDGSHAFKALTRLERAIVAATMLTMWSIAGNSLLGILCVVSAFRALQKSAPQDRDLPVLFEFVFLVVTLALLSTIHVDIYSQR